MGDLPVNLRLTSQTTDRCYDLSRVDFDSSVPGGFGQATFTVPRLVSAPPEDLALFTRVTMYDRRTGDIAWAGELKDPGRSVGDDGHTWSMSAIGGGLHADDVAEPRAYIVSGPDGWRMAFQSDPAMSVEAGNPPDIVDAEDDDAEIDGMVLAIPQGTVVGANGRIGMSYGPSADAKVAVGALSYRSKEGVTSGGWQVEAFTVDADGVGQEMIREANFDETLSAAGGEPKYIGVDWTGRREGFRIRAVRNLGGATTAGADIWSSIRQLRITMQLKYLDGTNITSDSFYADGFLYAHRVVRDLLGRSLPMFIADDVGLYAGTQEIDQLAYWDGCRPSDVLNDLMTLEDAYWAAWEPNTAGMYRFEWVAWPDQPRYIVSTVDGFDSPGSSTEVYNRINVRYRRNGRSRTYEATQVVDGLTYDRAPDDVDLGDELGSLANATRYAERFLARHAAPTNSGTVTVARPVFDRLEGRWVDPWMLRPGCLVSVLDVMPHPDTLNPATQTGATTFRVAEVSVSCDESGTSATLSLDTPAFNEERLLARLATRRVRKR